MSARIQALYDGRTQSAQQALTAPSTESEKDAMPLQVEIVRPRLRASEWAVMIVGEYLIAVPLMTAVAMLLLGACHHEIDPRIPAFGYLQTLLALYTLRIITHFVTAWDTYKLWTREAKKASR